MKLIYNKNLIRIISITFILLGAVIVILSVFTVVSLKLQQAIMIKSSILQNSENANPPSAKNKNTMPSKRDGKYNVTERENYKNGMIIILIPKLGVKAGITNGTSREKLCIGPGLYENSPLPDHKGANVCIAGHRITYGAWFRNVDKLKAGDYITLCFYGKNYLYKVDKVFIANKNDWSVTKPLGYSAITLTSCHPKGSAKQRIIVRGRLIKVYENSPKIIYNNLFKITT